MLKESESQVCFGTQGLIPGGEPNIQPGWIGSASWVPFGNFEGARMPILCIDDN